MENLKLKIETTQTSLLLHQEQQSLTRLEQVVMQDLPKETQAQLLNMPTEEAKLWLLLLMEATRARYTFSTAEMLLMVESLKLFPLEMVRRAFEHIRQNPPEGYKGMPSETEIIAAIKLLRAEDFAEARRRQDEAYNEEMRELKRRRDGGAKFFGIDDLMKDFREQHGHELEDHFAMEPVTPAAKQETDEEYEARARKRRAQMLEDLYRAKPELRGTITFKDEQPKENP